MIKLNPDIDLVKDIYRRLSENDGYCPCSVAQITDTRCMCKEFREQKSGMCRCGLYIKEIDSLD